MCIYIYLYSSVPWEFWVFLIIRWREGRAATDVLSLQMSLFTNTNLYNLHKSHTSLKCFPSYYYRPGNLLISAPLDPAANKNIESTFYLHWKKSPTMSDGNVSGPLIITMRRIFTPPSSIFFFFFPHIVLASVFTLIKTVSPPPFHFRGSRL